MFFFHILGMSSSQLTKSIIFQRGSNHQPVMIYPEKSMAVGSQIPEVLGDVLKDSPRQLQDGDDFLELRDLFLVMLIIHIHTYTYIYIHIHTYTYIYMSYTCHIHVIYIHIHTYTYIYIHIHTYTYIYIHIHTYTYIYIHIHTYTSRRKGNRASVLIGCFQESHNHL